MSSSQGLKMVLRLDDASVAMMPKLIFGGFGGRDQP